MLPQCMVCLSDFESGDRVRTLPCGHYFHLSCADAWLFGPSNQNTDPRQHLRIRCPICNTDVTGRRSSNWGVESSDRSPLQGNLGAFATDDTCSSAERGEGNRVTVEDLDDLDARSGEGADEAKAPERDEGGLSGGDGPTRDVAETRTARNAVLPV